MFLSAVPGKAEPLSPGATPDFNLISAGGAISIYFAGAAAAYSHLVFLDQDDPARDPLIRTDAASVGDRVDAGELERGTPMRFRLHVIDTGENFYSGAAAMNPDGLGHAVAESWTPSAAIPVSGVLLRFEDLLGGGDLDYNDVQFVVANVRLSDSAPVPEPSTLLLCAGAAGLAYARRRRVRDRRT